MQDVVLEGCIVITHRCHFCQDRQENYGVFAPEWYDCMLHIEPSMVFCHQNPRFERHCPSVLAVTALALSYESYVTTIQLSVLWNWGWLLRGKWKFELCGCTVKESNILQLDILPKYLYLSSLSFPSVLYGKLTRVFYYNALARISESNVGQSAGKWPCS